MMSKEEVAQIMQYCKENGVTYKARLEELGIPRWRFFDSETAYAREQSERAAPGSEFLQLTCGGDFVPAPSFSSAKGSGPSRRKTWAGTFGQPNLESRDDVKGTIEWRDLVLVVEGIMENPDSRRQRLETLKRLRKY